MAPAPGTAISLPSIQEWRQGGGAEAPLVARKRASRYNMKFCTLRAGDSGDPDE
jgi:hypothetical protein